MKRSVIVNHIFPTIFCEKESEQAAGKKRANPSIIIIKEIEKSFFVFHQELMLLFQF
jgi:hypothetical protein